jgi:1,4-alpha-glucan branching enzyme
MLNMINFIRMSIKKYYSKTKPVCRVTFSIPKNIAKSAQLVQLLGDFNRWSHFEPPMKKTKEGRFITTKEFPINKEYQFRYLLNGTQWINDLKADKYKPSGVGNSENSIIVL